MVLRIGSIILFSIILLSLFSLSAFAEDEGKLDCYDEYKEMLSALPEDSAALLPDKLYSENVSDIASGAQELADFGYIMKTVLSFIGLELEGALKLFATLMGVLILAATMNALKDSFSSSALSSA